MKTRHRFKTDDGAEQIFFLHNASSAPTVQRYAIWVRDKGSDGVTRGYHNSQNVCLLLLKIETEKPFTDKAVKGKVQGFPTQEEIVFPKKSSTFHHIFNLNTWSEISLIQHWWRNPKTETVYQEYLRRQAELGTAGCHSRKPSCSFKHNLLSPLLTKPTT